MTNWFFTLNAIQILDPDFNASEAPEGTRSGVIEVPAGRSIELDAETAKALEKHGAVVAATKAQITAEEDFREANGNLIARQTLSAARGGMVAAGANRAIRQTTAPTADVASTKGGKAKAGKTTPDEGKDDNDSLL